MVAALREPDGLGRLGADPILVPRDVPRHRDDELAGHARERDDAHMRLAEALRDAADRAPVVARVEDFRRLDHLLLALREPSQDRLGDDRLFGELPTGIEERGEAAPPPALTRDGRRRRAAFLDPAMFDRDLLAERADVDEVLAVRSEPDRTLAEKERPLADRARLLLLLSHEL